jgi:hypothetical protein
MPILVVVAADNVPREAMPDGFTLDASWPVPSPISVAVVVAVAITVITARVVVSA